MLNFNEGDAVRAVDAKTIQTLLREAETAPRRRSHLLLHNDHADQVQRLIIAAAHNSYVRPHIHNDQWEMLILLHGSGLLTEFDENGILQNLTRLEKSGTNIVQINNGTIHGFVVTGDHAIVMEVKPGPFQTNDFAPWSPEEGSTEMKRFMDWSTTATPGEVWASGGIETGGP